MNTSRLTDRSPEIPKKVLTIKTVQCVENEQSSHHSSEADDLCDDPLEDITIPIEDSEMRDRKDSNDADEGLMDTYIRTRHRKLSFNTTPERGKFIQRVLGIIAFQLIMTSAMVAVMVHFANTRYRETVPWLYSRAAVLVSLTMVIAMLTLFTWSSRAVLHKFPHNLIVVCVWTTFESYAISSACFTYKSQLLIYAFGITACLVVTATIINMMLPKKYLYYHIEWFFAVLLGWAVLGIASKALHLSMLHYAVTALGIAVFMAFVAISVGMAIGNNGSFDDEDYVAAAITIYVSFTGVFIMVLMCFQIPMVKTS